MDIKDYQKEENWKCYFRIKVIPKAPKTEFFSVLGDWTLKIRIKAIPEKWKANKELIRYISSELSIQKDRIEIISWLTDQIKLIRINYNNDTI